ncbi:MFS transporter [Actinomyces sp. ZJ308]|uniref:MFS transporter n=1 Tax=Actinomyces sp. ZJ308 TaxID=2708342 RepID=UPI001AB039A9|nr:MFS transporter [Actinomyces sp. ZJ308]
MNTTDAPAHPPSASGSLDDVDRAPRRAWLGLLVVLGPVLLVSMDGSVLFLAMPTITRSIGPSADEALWILDIYGFAVSSLLITFGNLGDRFGRLRFLLGGVLVFGVGSGLAALSPSPGWLIASRAVMGLGGSTLLPSGLAVLSELFVSPRLRSRAIGIFAATFAAGFAIGPVIGGLLLNRFPWGSVFLINLPVVAVFLLMAPFVLREVRAARPAAVDLLSIGLSATGMFLSVYAVKRAAAYGLSPLVAMSAAAGAGLLTWFLMRQRRLEHPLVDVGLFKGRVFTIAILTGVISLVVWSAAAYLSGVYLQSVLGLSVLTAALLALPGALVLTTSCVLTPALADRIGQRRALLTCHVAMAGGLALLLLTRTAAGVGWFIASTAVAGVGYGISFSLVADTAVGAVPPERAGAAGAIAETSNEVGNALGIALLGSTATLVFRLRGPGTAPTVGESLDAARSASVVDQAKAAFVDGFHLAVALAVLLCAALGALALRWLSRSGQ